jgi:quaternary ammonium compound-resistance protein SugE
MAWFYLFIAGLMEIGWAIGLKYTDGFTRPIPSILTGSAIVCSMLFLALAMRTIPVGTAYAIWVGIGAFGTAIMGIYLFNESRELLRLFFIFLLLVSVIGLKLASPD